MTILWILVWLVLALVVITRLMASRAEQQVPRAGTLVPVKGGVIHYVEQGPKDAPPLVMIHGLSGVLQHFTYAMADDLAGDFRVIMMDRPGCGYSTRDADGLAAMPEQAAMLNEFLDTIGVRNPVLVGHSLGGAMSLTMALQRPDNIAALALICPATQPQDQIPEVFKPLAVKSEALRRVMGHVLAVPLGWLTMNKVLGEVFAPETPPSDFMHKAGGVLGLRPSSYIGASADVMEAMGSVERVVSRFDDELKVPGAILFGADDAVLSPALHGHAMARYGLDCEEVPGRGHMLPMTAPQECCAFVRRVAATVA